MARTLLGELSLLMDEGRTQELSRDMSTLRQRISPVPARLEFDHLPAGFRRILRLEPVPPSSPATAVAYVEAAASPPPTDADLAHLDLVTAAEAIRTGAVSSRELVSACLARIDRLQPKLYCFIEIDGKSALAAADRADAVLGARGSARSARRS